jgi:hypothetical protein
MKNLSVLITAIIALGIISISFTSKKVNRLQVRGEGHETVPEKLFIDDAFFTKYKLEQAVRSNQKIHDWTSMDETNKYVVVNDIRWEFDKPEQALDYHRKNLSVNSQKGVELHPRISIAGVEELHVYKESASIENLNKDLGINTMEYCYLFVVDRVVAKIWVKVNGNVSVEEASLFAREAAKTIQKALGK